MYEHYYTSSDTNISFSRGDKKVYIDTAISMSYTTNISSVPIYELGSPIPVAFSSGNILVQGQMDVVFTSFNYIPRVISYLAGEEVFTPQEVQLSNITRSSESLDQMITEELEMLEQKQTDIIKMTNPIKTYNTLGEYARPDYSSSLVDVRHLFDIVVDMNNSNATMDGVSSQIKLEGVKLISHSFATTSRDDSNVVLRYIFIAMNAA